MKLVTLVFYCQQVFVGVVKEMIQQFKNMQFNKKSALYRVALFSAILALNGCSTVNEYAQNLFDSITPYKIAVVQGNFVSEDQADQLQKGMTREEITTLLGKPLIADVFHQDRWDYVFYFKRGNRTVVPEHKLTLIFKNDRLESWSKPDLLLTEYALLDDIDGKKPEDAKTKPSAVKPEKDTHSQQANISSKDSKDDKYDNSIPLDVRRSVQAVNLPSSPIGDELVKNQTQTGAKFNQGVAQSNINKAPSQHAVQPLEGNQQKVQSQFTFSLPARATPAKSNAIGPQAGDEELYKKVPERDSSSQLSDEPPQHVSE